MNSITTTTTPTLTNSDRQITTATSKRSGGAQTNSKIKVKIQKMRDDNHHQQQALQDQRQVSQYHHKSRIVSPCQSLTGSRDGGNSGVARNFNEPGLLDEDASNTTTISGDIEKYKPFFQPIEQQQEHRQQQQQQQHEIDGEENDDNCYHQNDFEMDLSTNQNELIAYLPLPSRLFEVPATKENNVNETPLKPSNIVTGSSNDNELVVHKGVIMNTVTTESNSSDVVAEEIQVAAAILCLLKSSTPPPLHSSSSCPSPLRLFSSLSNNLEQYSLSSSSTSTSSQPSFTRSSLDRHMSAEERDYIAEAIVNDETIMNRSRDNRHHRRHRTKEKNTPPPSTSRSSSNSNSNSNSSSSSSSSSSRKQNKHQNQTALVPNRLSLPNDGEELNSLHCFVRSNLLEVFVVPDENMQRKRKKRRKHAALCDTSNIKHSPPPTTNRAATYCGSCSEADEGSDHSDGGGNNNNSEDEEDDSENDVAAITTRGTNCRQDRSNSRLRTTITNNNHASNITATAATIDTRLFPGRVGLRCIHCAHVPRARRKKRKRTCTNDVDGDDVDNNDYPPNDTEEVNADYSPKATMSLFYPKSLADLYRAVCTWQRVHFRECTHIPQSVRDTYWSLKESDRSRGKTKYWARSAKTLGLVDVEGFHGRGGLRFEL